MNRKRFSCPCIGVIAVRQCLMLLMKTFSIKLGTPNCDASANEKLSNG